MNFNSSTYYSIQNFGTDYYVGRNATTNPASSPTAWQIGRCPGSDALFIGYGDSCLVPQGSGPLGLVACTASHATWLLRYANGNDISDGFYLTNTEASNSLLLSSDLGPPPAILMAENSGVTIANPYFAWAFRIIAQSSWPDNGPRALDFCGNIQPSSNLTLPATSSAPSNPFTFSNLNGFPLSAAASTTQTSSMISSRTTRASSDRASNSQQATLTNTQQTSMSPTRSQASTKSLEPKKVLLLAILAVIMCLQ